MSNISQKLQLSASKQTNKKSERTPNKKAKDSSEKRDIEIPNLNI